MSEVTCPDVRLIADALTDQSWRAGKPRAEQGVFARAAGGPPGRDLRQRSDRLTWLAIERRLMRMGWLWCGARRGIWCLPRALPEGRGRALARIRDRG